MTRRRLWLAVGVVAGVGGLVGALTRTTDATPGSATTVLVGLVAIAAGVWRARDWVTHEPDAAGPADPEAPTAVAVPGAAFDRMLSRVPAVPSGGRNNRLVTARQTIRDVVIDALATHRGVDREAAAAAVDAGEWTDDRYAAELFTTASGAGNSVTESVTGTITGESPFQRRAAHAAAEVERLTRSDLDRPDEESNDAGEGSSGPAGEDGSPAGSADDGGTDGAADDGGTDR